MSAKTVGTGLRARFALGFLPQESYLKSLRDNQPRIDKIRNLNAEIPVSLSNRKGEVVRICGEITVKAGRKQFKEAQDQINAELIPALNAAEPEADEHLRKRALYDQQRPPAELALDGLKKHAQHAHVNDKISAAQTYLDDAADDTRLGDLDSALDGLKNAKKECTEGKGFADEFAKYVVKRAEAGAIVQSMKDLTDDSEYKVLWQQLKDALTSADGEAAARNYVHAMDLAQILHSTLKGVLKTKLVDEVRPKIQDTKNKVAGQPNAARLIDPELKEIDKLQGELESNLNASKWSRVIFAGKGPLSSLVPLAGKMADRRIAYDAERVIAVGKIEGLKTHKTLLGQMFSMNKLVEKADGLATREAMRFEDGIAELKKIVANCQDLLQVAADAKAYNDARLPADQKLTELKKLPAAGNLGDQIAAIEKQLTQADKLTGDVETVSGQKIIRSDAGSQDWKAATTVVKQAASDMTAAEALAAGLAAATQAQAAAAAAGDAGAITRAVEELRKQAAAAEKKLHADLAAHEFSHIKASLDEATEQAAQGQIEIAKIPLQGAAELLLTAQTVQMQHAQFLERHKLIEGRVKSLNGLTDPTPDKIQPRIDAVTTALAEATKEDTARAWDKSAAALHRAEDAAAEAEQVAQLRKEFDAAAKLVETARNTLTDNTLKGKVLDTITKATEQAGKFRFDLANKGLGTAQAQIESEKVASLARTNTADPQFLAKAKNMLKAEGGDKLIDELVKNLPETAEAMKAMVVLARERFGVELKSDAGDSAKSAKKMWEMLTKVPQQSKDNPSLKKLERREPTKNGGFYDSTGDLVVMNGRPGQSMQKFGPNLLNSRNQKQLPDDIPDQFKPTSDADLDYFDFATLHEVGHAVDDRMRFMIAREGKAEFGGWKTYGADIEPIAQAVAKAKGYDSKPEQIAYVVEKILGNDPQPPTPPSGQEAAWNDARQKVDDWYAIATNEKCWWSQPDCTALDIGGTIYHEAYKKSWVSYPASERKKGMTGYQFRAPGEWFAELYACFHSGKLKNGHPAMKWIKSLSL